MTHITHIYLYLFIGRKTKRLSSRISRRPEDKQS